MFDLTKEVILETKYQKIYQRLRLAVFLLFILSSTYFAYRLLFPSQYFSFNSGAKNNSLHSDGTSDGASLFSAYSPENFSKANLQIVLDGKISVPQPTTISVRKTYKAFTFPISQPIGFPTAIPEFSGFADGALLSFGFGGSSTL